MSHILPIWFPSKWWCNALALSLACSRSLHYLPPPLFSFLAQCWWSHHLNLAELKQKLQCNQNSPRPSSRRTETRWCNCHWKRVNRERNSAASEGPAQLPAGSQENPGTGLTWLTGADQKILHTNALAPECPHGFRKIRQLEKEEIEQETRRAAEKPWSGRSVFVWVWGEWIALLLQAMPFDWDFSALAAQGWNRAPCFWRITTGPFLGVPANVQVQGTFFLHYLKSTRKAPSRTALQAYEPTHCCCLPHI